jgi:hypothetical protein
LANHKQKLPMAAIEAKRRFFLRNWSIRNLLAYRNDMNIIIEDLSYMLSTKFRFIWPSGFRGEDLFFNWLTRNKNCLLRSCVLTDRDDMNNLYRGNVIYTFFHVSAHLANRFQRRRLFLNWPTRNNNCLRRPCLLTDRDDMNILYRGPVIDAFF